MYEVRVKVFSSLYSWAQFFDRQDLIEYLNEFDEDYRSIDYIVYYDDDDKVYNIYDEVIEEVEVWRNSYSWEDLEDVD